jgi:hypothetical protein
MINFKFEIVNPWSSRFNNIFCYAGSTPIKNKSWEVQAMRTDDIVSLDFRITTRCDHAGVDLWLGLASYSINFRWYDTRHWDYSHGRYCVYNEDME